MGLIADRMAARSQKREEPKPGIATKARRTGFEVEAGLGIVLDTMSSEQFMAELERRVGFKARIAKETKDRKAKLDTMRTDIATAGQKATGATSRSNDLLEKLGRELKEKSPEIYKQVVREIQSDRDRDYGHGSSKEFPSEYSVGARLANAYDLDNMELAVRKASVEDARAFVKQFLGKTTAGKKVVAAGEADQDYDTEFFDAAVDALAEAGYPGATHEEFDKYQGVYLKVPRVGKFWVTDYHVVGKPKSDKAKYRDAVLVGPDGGEYSANRGDYFNFPKGKPMTGNTLMLTTLDGKKQIIKNPTVNQLPDLSDVRRGFQYDGEPTPVYTLTEEKTETPVTITGKDFTDLIGACNEIAKTSHTASMRQTRNGTGDSQRKPHIEAGVGRVRVKAAIEVITKTADMIEASGATRVMADAVLDAYGETSKAMGQSVKTSTPQLEVLRELRNRGWTVKPEKDITPTNFIAYRPEGRNARAAKDEPITDTLINEGAKVEKEHGATYENIKAYYAEHGEFPPFDTVTEWIALDHLKEFEDYYEALEVMEEELKAGKKEARKVKAEHSREVVERVAEELGKAQNISIKDVQDVADHLEQGLKAEDIAELYADWSVDDIVQVIEKLEMYAAENAEVSDDSEPQEDDYKISDDRGKTAVSTHKFLGHFADQESAEEFIRKDAKKHNFYPNVWSISDHGNAHLLTDFDYGN